MKTFKQYLNESKITVPEMEKIIKDEGKKFFGKDIEVGGMMKGEGEFEIEITPSGNKTIKAFINVLKKGPFKGKRIGYEIYNDEEAAIRHPNIR